MAHHRGGCTWYSSAETLRRCLCAGIHIPKGTSLAVSMYAMQRDPSLWPRPEEFIPERWLDSEAATLGLTPVKDSWMSFGDGDPSSLWYLSICSCWGHRNEVHAKQTALTGAVSHHCPSLCKSSLMCWHRLSKVQL